MRTLIIPDIHTRFDIAESIIDKENPDKIVFLGDYFDNWDDSPEIAHQVALWLKESLKDPKRTHLIGNHDISYITNGSNPCSGWNGAKQMFINRVKINWKSLQYYTFVDDWICTHAGVSKEFYDAFNVNDLNVKNFLLFMKEKYDYRLHMCSYTRGGNDSYPGILWCDYGEFIDIPNTKQIFGHTKGPVRRLEHKNISAEHICLDSALHDYAIYENGKMEIFRVPGRE